MKINLLLFIIFFCINKNKLSQLKADVPKFCAGQFVSSNANSAARENGNSSIVIKNSSTNSNFTNTTSNTFQNTPNSYSFFSILIGLFGIYLFGIMLYLVKLVEESYKCMKEHINSRFSTFRPLSFDEINKIRPLELEDMNVFMSSLIFFEKRADDALFQLGDIELSYMKIVRKIEVYDHVNNSWTDNYEESSKILESYQNKFNKDTIAKLFSHRISLGQGRIHCFLLKEEYFENMEKFEVIKLKSENEGFEHKKFPILEEILDYSNHSLTLTYNEEGRIIISNNHLEIIRISLLGVLFIYCSVKSLMSLSWQKLKTKF
jgi:hypothetical protein